VCDKVVSAAEAVTIIRSGDMIATSGFVGVGTPDEIYCALERRFLETGRPRELGRRVPGRVMQDARPGRRGGSSPAMSPATRASALSEQDGSAFWRCCPVYCWSPRLSSSRSPYFLMRALSVSSL
jgi:acyl CoA:acetate/3-ketoacid CoA transferase